MTALGTAPDASTALAHRGIRWHRTVVPVLSLVVLLAGRGLGADAPAPPDPSLLGDYATNMEHRRAIIEVARTGGDDVPSPFLLAAADALLRGGQPGAAGGLFRRVLARGPQPPWSGWADLGLGWVELAAGDLAGARAHYQRVAAGDWSRAVALLVVGLIDASQGQAAAVALLEQIAVAADTPMELRSAARVAAAYARYWSGDYAAAATAFRMSAEEYPQSALADDSLYGAARAQILTGDRDGGISGLRDLARGAGPEIDRARITRGLLGLEPRAVFHTSLQRYRGMPLGLPGELLAQLLDLDGHALAQIALHRMRQDEEPTDDSVADVVVAASKEQQKRAAARRRHAASISAPSAATSPAPGTDGAAMGGDHGPTGADPGVSGEATRGARDGASRIPGNEPRGTTLVTWLLLAAALAAVALGVSIRWPRPWSRHRPGARSLAERR